MQVTPCFSYYVTMVKCSTRIRQAIWTRFLEFWQCSVVAVYYVGSLTYLAVSYSVYKASYLSVFALVLCPLWLTGGSRTLWTGDVVEIKCQAPGERERVIFIAKKKQKLDQ